MAHLAGPRGIAQVIAHVDDSSWSLGSYGGVTRPHCALDFAHLVLTNPAVAQLYPDSAFARRAGPAPMHRQLFVSENSGQLTGRWTNSPVGSWRRKRGPWRVGLPRAHAKEAGGDHV